MLGSTFEGEDYVQNQEHQNQVGKVPLFSFLLFGVESRNKMFLGVDPFTYVTIASACLATLKHKFLQRNEIAYFPQAVNPKLRNAIRWFEFLMYTTSAVIEHCRNGPPPQVGGISVTGVDPRTHTVYEYIDCESEGCYHCTKNLSHLVSEKMQTLEMLRSYGHNVVSIFGCAFRDLCRSPQYQVFHEAVGIAWNQPLSPRESFVGGRTNACCLHYICSSDERIDYVDACSLYPTVNKYDKYPVGHPKIIVTASSVSQTPTVSFELEPTVRAKLVRGEYLGLVKCRVVPPRHLFHPVLPYRSKGKLMFPLCRSCILEECCDCEHSLDERALEGTWCTPELAKALAKGYVIAEVREVHHFERFKTGMFEDYVNTFLKRKQEASGWPQVISFLCP